MTNNTELSATLRDDSALMIDAREACAMVGVSRTVWCGWMNKGLVPAPKRFTARIVRWRRSEIVAWIEAGCPNRETWERTRGSVA